MIGGIRNTGMDYSIPKLVSHPPKRMKAVARHATPMIVGIQASSASNNGKLHLHWAGICWLALIKAGRALYTKLYRYYG